MPRAIHASSHTPLPSGSSMMHRPVFPAMKSLDGLGSIRGPSVVAGSSRGFPLPSSRTSSGSSSMGSFVNLKLAAEKLVKEQAAVKIDLEMANSKLKKAAEQIQSLEEKLQDANNENAKLKVKQNEDVKVWKGLELKLASTKTLCDELTETLELLSAQTHDAEMDKKFFNEKLLENSRLLDAFKSQMDVISGKLENAEESKKKGKQEMAELRKEREETVNSLHGELHALENLNKEKDAAIRQLENTIEENKVHVQSLDSVLKGVQYELKLKEGLCNSLQADLVNLDNEKTALQSTNEHVTKKLIESSEEISHLQKKVRDLVSKIEELDKHSKTLSDNLAQLLSTFEGYKNLSGQKEDLVTQFSNMKINQLQKQCTSIASENEAFHAETEILKSRVLELEKEREFAMVQHAEECRLAEDKIRMLEAKAERYESGKKELEALLIKLEDKIKFLTDTSSITENKMQELLSKISGLEHENQDLQQRMQSVILQKSEKNETLQSKISEHEAHAASLENQITHLRGILNDKEQLSNQYKEKQKLLEDQLAEIKASLASAENKLVEARMQYDLMLEGKQTELSKHIKEISQRNDQAINEIRRKYEMEKTDIVNAEKEKVDKLIKEVEKRYEERIKESKEEAQKSLYRIQEEHAATISRIQNEYNEKELNLRAHHELELERVHFQLENESKEKTSSLKKEHGIQMLSLRHELEDECGKLREELQLQRSKEEKQRALLQLQWKVMDQRSQQKDLDLNHEKEHSVSSIKMRDLDIVKEKQIPRIQKQKKDIDISGIMRTPLANMLRRAEKGNAGSAVSLSKHSRKVTHHEYEVQTTNGKTITKRRKTKSTVSFGDPPVHGKVKPTTPLVASKAIDVRQPRPSNIGDLFTEGSLNPYTDDPYAFD